LVVHFFAPWQFQTACLIFFIFFGDMGWRHGPGLIEAITPFFILPSSHHFLCSLPPEFRSKAKQFPEILIDGSKQKNRCSDFFVGYCTLNFFFKIQCFRKIDHWSINTHLIFLHKGIRGSCVYGMLSKLEWSQTLFLVVKSR
jgi:hypothetical protein